MNDYARPLAVVTGASSGIGLELAKLCAKNGFELLLAADRSFESALDQLAEHGAEVDTSTRILPPRKASMPCSPGSAADAWMSS